MSMFEKLAFYTAFNKRGLKRLLACIDLNEIVKLKETNTEQHSYNEPIYYLSLLLRDSGLGDMYTEFDLVASKL